MPDWKDVFLKVATHAENHFDMLKFHLQRRLDHDALCIMPYLGHGTAEVLHVLGRVMEANNVSRPADNDAIWKNLLNIYRRFDTDEVPYARLRVTFGDQSMEVTTNEEGFFDAQIMPSIPLPTDRIIHEVQLELLDIPGRENLPKITASAKVIVPPPGSQFGVISDLDDTVIQTDVLHLVKLARNTFLRNSRTRLPFEGVAAFYRALEAGTNNSYNPIFYVSSSPWNLYDLLLDFFEVRGIPIGPFFLKDLGLAEYQLIDSGHETHKLGAINTILAMQPNLPFILIGDSGQHDPEIYAKAVELHPGRILAIYIRDVNPGDERDRVILRLADKVKVFGTEMKLVPDTVGAAEHAALKGYISEEELLTIRVERTEDSKEPEEVEKHITPETSEKLEEKQDKV